MSLLTSASKSDTIDSPRKRRPTERVIENGDPLAHKKAKLALTTRDVQKSSDKGAQGLKKRTWGRFFS
jgi:hypothetical protein